MKTIYILADCYEREIVMTKYDTHEDAYNAMKKELDYVLGFDGSDDIAAKEAGYTIGCDFDINKWSAWANVKNQNNDWVIDKFEI